MSDKKTALVTGGTRGIGLGIALALAQTGCYNLVITGRGESSSVANALTELRKHCEAEYYSCDLADVAAHSKLIAAVDARFGRLDVLVNNAGVAPKVRASILETTPESFDFVVDTNLRGTYFLTQAAANYMLAHPREGQAIVNISSISAYTSSTNRGEYCISKAGISMITALFADGLAESGIAVYEVRPGIIKTDMTSAVTAKYDALINGGLLPTKRWGLPEDVGSAVAALIGGAFRYSTGQVVNVDGGFHLRRL